MSRSRASSATSSAPEKTLWSVTAIAPSPSASACSSSSRGRDAAVVRRARVRCAGRRRSSRARRAARRHRFAGAPASSQLLVDLLQLARDVGERLSLRGRSRGDGPPLAIRGVVREPAHLRRSELRLLVRARRRGDCCAGSGGFEPQPRDAVRRGDEDRGVGQNRRAARRVSRGAHVDAVEQRARNVRPLRQRLRSQQREPPVGQLAERVQRRAQQRSLRRAPLEDDQALLVRGLEQRRVDALRDEPVIAGEAERRRGRRVLGGGEQDVEPARAAARAERGRADTRAAPARRTSRRPDSRPRAARGTKGWGAPARSRGRRRSVRRATRARRWRARRREHPRGCDARSARPGPSASSSPPFSDPFSAARPAARSAARFDDAMIVTACPSTRSSRATPATCSFTSCGCDHAKGVTRQMRSAIGAPESSPGLSNPGPSRAGAR